MDIITHDKPFLATAPPAEPAVKFVELVDLGIITVHSDYDHATQLGTFARILKKAFNRHSDALTDRNYRNPTRILKPGDKLRVRAFKQIAPGATTAVERMAFLKSLNAVLTGAQGMSLVFEQKRDLLPKGFWYASFDAKDRLWKDAIGFYRVPFISATEVGDFRSRRGRFQNPWGAGDAFFCMTDVV